jgi:hypothetical protein
MTLEAGHVALPVSEWDTGKKVAGYDRDRAGCDGRSCDEGSDVGCDRDNDAYVCRAFDKAEVSPSYRFYGAWGGK